jgi:hypothetical protein
MKNPKIKSLLILVFVFHFSQVSSQEEDPCGVLDQCINSAATLLIPNWPLPIVSCPYPGGSSYCCTTCDTDNPPKDDID